MSSKDWRDRLVDTLRAALGKSAAPILPAHAVGQPQALPEEVSRLSDAYAEIPSVYAAVYAIAHAFAAVPLIAYKRTPTGVMPVPNHPILELLDPRFGKPNDVCSAYDLWEGHSTLLELAGNAFWLLEGNAVKIGGPPSMVSLLRPDAVRIVSNADGSPHHYEYGPWGKAQRYEKEEVLHFSFYNPLSATLGFPSIQPAKTAILLDYYANKFNSTFFRQGAKLGPVVRFEDGTGITNVVEAMRVFNEQHAGAANAHKAKGIVAADVTFPDTSHADMDFYNGLKYTDSRVCMTTGVPPVLLTLLEGSHYENTEAQIRIFVENTMIPKFRKRDANLNRTLMPRYGDNVFVGFDRSALTAVRQALQEIRQTSQVFVNMGSMTPNEAREYLETGEIPSLPPLEGGDEIREPVQQFDPNAEDSANPPKTRAPLRVKRKSPIDRLISEVEREGASRRAAMLNAKGSASRSRRSSRVGTLSPAYRRLLLTSYSDQEKALLSNIDDIVRGSTTNAMFLPEVNGRNGSAIPGRLTNGLDKIDDLIKGIRSGDEKKVKKLYATLVGDFGKSAMKDLGPAAADVAFSLGSPRVVNYIAKSGLEKLTNLDATTADRVKAAFRSALVEAQLAGDNSIQTATRIMEAAVEDTYRSRRENANRVAQTETTFAYNFAEHEAWSQSGVVSTKLWHTQGDDFVRGEDEGDEFDHAAMEGVEVGIDEAFEVPSENGVEELMFPGDDSGSAGNVINCRCILLPGTIKTSRSPDDGFNSVRSSIREMGRPIFGANGKEDA